MKLMVASTYSALPLKVFALTKQVLLSFALGFQQTATLFISSFIHMRLPSCTFVLPLSKA